jgi:sugar diacid utilization regulator
LAYSSLPDQRIDALREQGILGRHVPDMERNLAQYRTVLAGQGVTRFPEVSDEFARAAIAVKAGAKPLGTIWAIENLGGITPEGELLLLEGARLAAQHILRSQNHNKLELQVREATLRSALDESLSAKEIAYRLALPAGTELSLVGFAAIANSHGTAPLITHLGHELSQYLALFRPDAAITTTPRTVYVLLPGGESESVVRLVNGALTAIHVAFKDQICAAIAHTSTQPADLPSMRREIDDILRVTTLNPDLPTVAKLDDVHTRVLLAHVADELMREPGLKHPGIEAMLAYDLENKTYYADSVTAWLDAVGDIAFAAQSLFIHANTLRYRLRRVKDLFNINLDNPDDCLAVWMQLRLVAEKR